MIDLAAPPLALGFANPWMLWWLAAAAVPLLVHWWNKRKQHETSWAAMAFLVAAMRSQARRIRIRQWLLLAVRTLLIVLLVLAVAEPLGTRLGLPPTPGMRTHKVLVIDGSLSMAYQATDTSRFAHGKRLASRIVEESRRGDGFTLVLMTAPARTIVAAPAFAPSDLLQEIRRLTLPHAGGDLTGALASVERILKRAAQEHPELQRNEVYFLTDLGRTSWLALQGGAPSDATPASPPVAELNAGPPTAAAAPAAGDAGEIPDRQRLAATNRAQVTRLASMATLVVLDLGQSDSPNLAITSLTSADSPIAVGTDIVFDAVVRNFGYPAQTGRGVQWWVDGARAKRATVDIPAHGQTSIRFAHRFAAPGSHTVELRLDSDRLDIDNHRWRSVQVRSFLHVLCVSGKPGASRYLALALDPQQSPSAPIRTEVIPDSALIETDLDEYDAVLLANVGQFTAGEARLLDRYARHGGGLVFFLGDQVLADRYNRELADESPSGVRLLPARVGAVVTEPQYGLDPLAYRHPVVAPFRGRERSGLLTTPVYRYFRLAVPDGWRQSRVALAFRNGDPAVVEGPVQRGRAILVATAASLTSTDAASQTPWTVMPVWPSFLPLVHELLAHAIGSQQDQYNLRVGQTFGASARPTSRPAFVTVAKPAGRRARQRIEDRGEDVGWTFDATDKSGIYRVHVPAAEPDVLHFAANVDTGESDLTRVEPQDLPRQFVVRTDWQDPGPSPSDVFRRRRGWQRWLLYSTVGLLLAETGLAWWLGQGVVRR